MKIFGNYSLRSIKTHSYFVKLNNFSFGAKASGNQAQAQGNKQAKQEAAPQATKVQGTGQPKKSAPVQKEALPYKPLDQMTKEERLIKGASAKKEVYDHFGGKQYLDSWKKAALWEVIAKKKRRIYLNTADNYIDNCKLIINAKRMRTLNDNYLDLALRKNEIVVVIKARDNYPEVQIVCDLSQLHRHFARRYCTSRFYHFKLPNGEEIKCLLDNFEQHYFYHDKIFKATFNRFIYGQPNYLKLPIHITGLDKNFYISEYNCDVMMDVNDVEVWMFDDKIPNALEIDALHMIPKDPILVKDLVNYLPISMHMHKSMKKIWQYPVCKILSNENSTIFARLLPFDMEDDDEDDDDDSLINRDLKPLSLKGSPPTPVSKASSKVFAQLKDKGATIENIKQVLKEKRDKGRKIVLEDREWRRKYGNGGEGGDDGQVDE